MSNQFKPSKEVDKVNLEYFYNKLRELHKEVFRNTQEPLDGGKILSIIVLVIKEEGYERYNNNWVKADAYYKTLLMELEDMKKNLIAYILTGKNDFRGS